MLQLVAAALPTKPEYVHLDYDPLKNCNRSYKPLTTLQNGFISINENETYCLGRCLTRLSDLENKQGIWRNASVANFQCDVVETFCPKSQGNGSYRMIHAQIVETKETDKKLPSEHLYSVYVILLDSTAHSQGIRNLPRTMHFFENSLQAVSFPYINKVGMNSVPNGVALWFGKRLETVDRRLFDLPDIVPDWTNEYVCGKFLDNETFLFKEFSDRGYKTLLAEDWMKGVLNSPNCRGFEKQPTDHYMRPFQVALTKDPPFDLRDNYKKENCIEQHRDILAYLQQFINAYKDTPKFGWIWLTNLGHGSQSGIIHADPDFFRFLLRNKKELDNSFVVILGDHGMRGGKTNVTHTELGSVDVNNPMFSISVPKRLRKETDVLMVLKENAALLQTTFDIRATLLDLLKYQPAANFTDRSYMVFENEYGSSLMRRQTEEERTCKTLFIPALYCTCRYPMKELESTSQFATNAGIFLVEHINGFLERMNVTTICQRLNYKQTLSISAYVPEEITNAYVVLVKVMPPCEGEFKSIVRYVNGTFEMATESVERLDGYGYKGSCIEKHFRHLCDCVYQEKPTK